MKQLNQEDRKPRPFSLKDRAMSFVYAYKGLRRFLSSEHNARLHLLATVGVFLLGFFFGIDRMEWMALIISMGLVWMAELLNTAIEKLVDEISKERNPRWAFIKDVAAGAVLVAAVIALSVGILVFWNRVWHWLWLVF